MSAPIEEISPSSTESVPVIATDSIPSTVEEPTEEVVVETQKETESAVNQPTAVESEATPSTSEPSTDANTESNAEASSSTTEPTTAAAADADKDETVPPMPELKPQSSFIELDTSNAIHVPHTSPSESESKDEDVVDEEDAIDDEDEDEDPASHQERLNAFLNALQFPNGVPPTSSGEETEFFSETEHGGMGMDPTQAAIAEVQEFINRQAAAAQKSASPAASSSSSTNGQTAEEKRAARKAAFNAKVEERRRAMGKAQDEDDEEEEFETPSAKAQREADEDEDEDEDDEDDVPQQASFTNWLKSRLRDTFSLKSARKAGNQAALLYDQAWSFGSKAAYVVGTLAFLAIPLAAAQMNEETSQGRQDRLFAANIPEEVKAEIWTGVKPVMNDQAFDLTLQQ